MPSTYRVSIIGSYMQQLLVNTLHFQPRTGETGDVADLLTRIDAWNTASFSKLHTSGRTFDLLEAREVGGVAPIAAAMTPTTKAGTETNLGGNPAEAIVVSIKSQFADRRRNGRIYLGGFPGGWVSQGQVSTGPGRQLLVQHLAAFGALWGPTGTDPWIMGIYSNPGITPKHPQPRPPIFTPFAQFRLNLITGSMRSRRIGVGS